MKILVGYILFALFSLSLGAAIINAEDVPDEYNTTAGHEKVGIAFNIRSFVASFGYPLQTYAVTTGDSYILTLHRIPYGKVNNNTQNRPPVLLMHCLYCTSGVFVMLGPENSLAFQLAEAGYDVWLGNNRGNTYSKKHKFLNPDKNASYWDFSFHELGYQDDPAMIDYILAKTQHKQLSYVGYSQGTAQFFVMASTRPEYKEKVNFMAALAPIAYMQHATHPLLPFIKKYYPYIQSFLAQRGIMEFLKHSTTLNAITDLVCGNEVYREICSLATFMVGGFDSPELNRTDLKIIYDVLPGGGSVKEVIHLFQTINSGHFRNYDYGKIGNVDKYGQLEPPDYNMTNITVPVALFYSMNDLFAAITDVEKLAEELPNSEKHLISYKYFTHLDYIIAKDLHSLVNFELINTLNMNNGIATVTTSTLSTKLTTTNQGPTPPSGSPPPDGSSQLPPSKPTGVPPPKSTTEGSGFVTKSSFMTSFISLVFLYLVL